jgi:protein-S-isoprenylcysteine O-methyltransferase Ste14
MLETILRDSIKAMWLLWLVYWIVAARQAKITRWREGMLVRVFDVALLSSAATLLLGREWLPPILGAQFLGQGIVLPIIGTAATALGLGLAIWARVHLGRNWSGTITLKEEHALIRTGPYARIRHPIYSGVLLALLGAVLAIGEVRVVGAFVLVLAAFVRRVLAEEKHLRELFPQYAAYSRETAALIPFLF